MFPYITVFGDLKGNIKEMILKNKKYIYEKNSYLVKSYGKIKSFKTNRVIREMLICGVEMLH